MIVTDGRDLGSMEGVYPRFQMGFNHGRSATFPRIRLQGRKPCNANAAFGSFDQNGLGGWGNPPTRESARPLHCSLPRGTNPSVSVCYHECPKAWAQPEGRFSSCIGNVSSLREYIPTTRTPHRRSRDLEARFPVPACDFTAEMLRGHTSSST